MPMIVSQRDYDLKVYWIACLREFNISWDTIWDLVWACSPDNPDALAPDDCIALARKLLPPEAVGVIVEHIEKIRPYWVPPNSEKGSPES